MSQPARPALHSTQYSSVSKRLKLVPTTSKSIICMIDRSIVFQWHISFLLDPNRKSFSRVPSIVAPSGVMHFPATIPPPAHPVITPLLYPIGRVHWLPSPPPPPPPPTSTPHFIVLLQPRHLHHHVTFHSLSPPMNYYSASSVEMAENIVHDRLPKSTTKKITPPTGERSWFFASLSCSSALLGKSWHKKNGVVGIISQSL